eukprot:3093937-Pleurochrysis_carterae.AAC.2
MSRPGGACRVLDRSRCQWYAGDHASRCTSSSNPTCLHNAHDRLRAAICIRLHVAHGPGSASVQSDLVADAPTIESHTHVRPSLNLLHRFNAQMRGVTARLLLAWTMYVHAWFPAGYETSTECLGGGVNHGSNTQRSARPMMDGDRAVAGA